MANESKDPIKRKRGPLVTYAAAARKRKTTPHTSHRDDQDADITDRDTPITHQDAVITDQDSAITDQDSAITDQDSAVTDRNGTAATDGDSNSEPADPPDPADPDEPVEPVEPTESTESVDPVDSHEPPNQDHLDEPFNQDDTAQDDTDQDDTEQDDTDQDDNDQDDTDQDGASVGAESDDSQDDSVVDHDTDGFWSVKRILQETRDRYLIDWEDAEDGTRYPPTWEPKSNANQAAVLEWELRKTKKQRKKKPKRH